MPRGDSPTAKAGAKDRSPTAKAGARRRSSSGTSLESVVENDEKGSSSASSASARAPDDDIDTRASSRPSTSRMYHVDSSEFDSYPIRDINIMKVRAADRADHVARVEAQTVLYTTLCELRAEIDYLQAQMKPLVHRNSTLEDEYMRLRTTESQMRPEIAEIQESRLAKDHGHQNETQECFQLRSESRLIKQEIDIDRQREVWAENQWQQRCELVASEIASAREDANGWQRSCNRQEEAEAQLEMAIVDVTDKATLEFSEERERVEYLNRGLEMRIANLQRGEQALRFELSQEQQKNEVLAESGAHDLLEHRMQSEAEIALLMESQELLHDEAQQVVGKWDTALKAEVAGASQVKAKLRKFCAEYSHAADHFLMQEQRLAQDNEKMHRYSAELQDKGHYLRDLKEKADRAAADASNRAGQIQNRLEIVELVHRQESSVREAAFRMKVAEKKPTSDVSCQCEETTIQLSPMPDVQRREPEPNPPQVTMNIYDYTDQSSEIRFID